MRKQKIRSAAGAGAARLRWYFLRLAFIAKPLRGRAKMVVFKQHYLVQAPNIRSAFAKADRILSVTEDLSGRGKLMGRRVLLQSVGILDLEPLYQELKSGVEIFDEREVIESEGAFKKEVLSGARRSRMIRNESRANADLLDVYWGDDFDLL